MKRGTMLGIAAGIFVAVALGLGVWWFATRPSGPEAAAQSYLDALAAGDGDKALTLLAEQPEDAISRPTALAHADALVTDVQVHEVTEGRDGREGTATADVAYSLDGTEHEASLELVETDGGWRLGPGALGALAPRTTIGHSVLVGGVPVPASGATPLLPAVYPVQAAPQNILTGSTTGTVTMGGAADVAVEASVSPDAITTAQEQLDLYAERCAAPAQTVPAHCGIRVPWAADLASLSSVAFRIEKTPQLSLSPDLKTFAATDGVIVATATGVARDGTEASFTYRADDWALRGTVTLTIDDMKLDVD